MAKYCVECGNQIVGEWNFCSQCGKEVYTPAENKTAVQENDLYAGKNCPYCQMPFKPGADIFVCPICKMPHHKECWKENDNKCTTFGCTGTTERAVAAEPAKEIAPQAMPVPISLPISIDIDYKAFFDEFNRDLIGTERIEITHALARGAIIGTIGGMIGGAIGRPLIGAIVGAILCTSIVLVLYDLRRPPAQ